MQMQFRVFIDDFIDENSFTGHVETNLGVVIVYDMN